MKKSNQHFISAKLNHFYDFFYKDKGYEQHCDIDKSKNSEFYSIGAIVECNNEVPSPCAYIRLILPLFSRYKNINLRIIKPRNIKNFKFDYLYCHRTAIDDEWIDEVISHCKNNKIPIKYDLDDDLISIGDSDHPEKKFYKKYKNTILKMIEHASEVSYSTKNLIHKYGYLNSNSKLLPNRLSSLVWDKFEKINLVKNNRINILYMGTYTHQDDLEMIIPAIKLIKREFSNVNFSIIGVTTSKKNNDIFEYIDVPCRDGLTYPSFIHWLKSNNKYHIGIAPLIDTSFNVCKSGIKFYDYSALGLSSICSRVAAYEDVVDDGLNGMLVDNNVFSWYQALRSLILNENLRLKLATSAMQSLELI